MVKRATLCASMVLLLFVLGFSFLQAEAQTASPSQAVISVSGVPTGNMGAAVEVTVNTAVVKLGSSASTDVSGGLVVVDSMSLGVGIISFDADLPASFMITVPLEGVSEGSSALSVGNVLNMLGGTALTGASASVDVSSVTVGAGGGPGPDTGAGGNLSADTFTVTITGDSVNTGMALNVTVAFTDSSVVSLDSGVTFMGTGATQLLTNVDADTGVLSVVWDGAISDNQAVITGMLKPGSMAGTTMINVAKVEASGGIDITDSVAVVVDPDEITNSSSSMTDVGTFTFIGPSTVTGPGKAAFGFKAEDTMGTISATLNGATVSFVAPDVGVAIVDLPASGMLDLMLVVGSTTIDLGDVTVMAGSGTKLPKVRRASANNRSANTKLTVKGSRLTGGTVEIVPTDRTASSETAKGKSIKATYPSSECIPDGSFVNVTTSAGTDARKIKVKGSCSNSLAP